MADKMHHPVQGADGGKSTDDIILLAQAHSLPLSAVGSKASNLARLMAVGLPVPEGLVIISGCLAGLRPLATDSLSAAHTGTDIQRFLESTGFRSEFEYVSSTIWPSGLPRLIVRSSAYCEDGLGSSAAGLFRSIAGIDSLDKLLIAIEQCWLAKFEPHVMAWCRERHIDPADLPLALVIQRQVEGEMGGVAMTIDPVSGHTGEMVLDMTDGSLEDLMQGRITPLALRIDKLYGRITGVPVKPSLLLQRLLDQLHLLLAFGVRAEDLFGCPQDIEWLFDSVAGWQIVQARPITTGRAIVRPTWEVVEGFEGFRRSLAELAGGPLTPLFRTLGLPALELGYSYIVNEWSNALILTEPLFSTINGYLYMRNNFPLSTKLRVLSLVPKALNGLLLYERSQFEEEAHRYEESVIELTSAELAQLSNPDLLLLVEQLMAAAGRYYFHLQFSILGTSYTNEAVVRWLLPRLVALEDPQAQSNMLFQGLWSDKDGQLAHEQLSSYLHGSQMLDLDFYYTWREDAQTYSPPDARLMAERDMLEVDIIKRHPLRGKILLRLARGAQFRARLREIGLARLGIAWKPAHRTVMEIARRMRERGLLLVLDDVFFLTKREILDPHYTSEYAHLYNALVGYRRESLAALGLLATPYYLPVIEASAAKVRQHRLPVAEHIHLNRGKILYGIGVSRGQAIGRVLIARTVDELSAYAPTDDEDVILVTRLVTPAWVPVFSKIAGLITDIGGMLSHSSILIREYGLPAVMGTGDATQRLRTGQVVRIDGSSGVVTIEES